MPVGVLLVEGDGKLDAALLGAVLKGHPLIEAAGPKHGLPQATSKRGSKQIEVAFLRDRDFEFDPPANATSQPEPCRTRDFGGKELPGWHWCRHEIENYLLEPGLVAAALGWDQAAFAAELVAAARRIRPYEVARWVVGSCRRAVPQPNRLTTRPDGVGDHGLPAACHDEPAMRDWVVNHAISFESTVRRAVCADAAAAEWAGPARCAQRLVPHAEQAGRPADQRLE